MDAEQRLCCNPFETQFPQFDDRGLRTRYDQPKLCKLLYLLLLRKQAVEKKGSKSP